MGSYIANILEETFKNSYFRQVLFTGKNMQLVVMSLLPMEEIGDEVHDHTDQFIRIEKGEGKALLDGVEHVLKNDHVLIIPAGVKHNIINTSGIEDLKLYTIYAPSQHKDGTIHKTKEEAMKEEEE